LSLSLLFSIKTVELQNPSPLATETLTGGGGGGGGGGAWGRLGSGTSPPVGGGLHLLLLLLLVLLPRHLGSRSGRPASAQRFGFWGFDLVGFLEENVTKK